MVATKVLISLCVLGFARAAPQLGVPVGFASPIAVRTTSTGANEQAIVTNVVTALQPSIASAVAAALRDISFSSSSRTSNSNFGSSSGSSSFNSGSSSSTGVAVGVKEDEVTVRPNYNYQFKVADDDEQTYITHEEARDGDDVTGAYSYIDPNGALITVNYQAGVMGYTQTLDKQDGAVQIRSKADSRSAGSSSASGSTSSSFGSSSGSSSSFGSSSFGSNSGSVRTRTTSSSLDSSALISQIIAALQPQISAAVSTAVSNQGGQTSFRTVTSNTGFASGANAGDRLTPLFGN